MYFLVNRIGVKILLTNGSLNDIEKSDSINQNMNYFELDLNILIKNFTL